MVSQFLVTTTGTQSPVVFTDLGARSFTHPTVDFDMLTEFSSEELAASADVQAAITAGHITVKNEAGTPITVVVEQQDVVTQAELTEVTSGDADALVYIDSAGTGLETNPALIIGSLDAYGRPKILDKRVDGGNGPIFMSGDWQADGGTSQVESEGIALYGPNANGDFDPPPNPNGAICRVLPNRFGLAQIITGVNGNSLFYVFRADHTEMFLANNTNARTFEVNRASGDAYANTMRVGGSAGAKLQSGTGSPEGVVVGSPGDLYLRKDGGAGSTMYVKESGSGTNTGWKIHLSSVQVEDEFTPTAGQVTFILSQAPTDPNSVVFIANGVVADDVADYTVSGVTVTWLNNLFVMETTDKVIIRYS